MRLFLAIQFQDNMKEALLELQSQWRKIGVRGHFVPAENLHLTLAFIGEYGNPDTVLDAISSVSFSPFTIQLDGAGNFYDTYWAGVTPNNELTHCVRRLRRALAENNIPFDRKNFVPHITLVRKGDCPIGLEAMLKNLPSASMNVSELSLMRSDRGKNGMIYTCIGNISTTE